ncbi:beta-eliminating lyase family protein [Yersinia rochesterensis]|uniref:ornithine decarboxylase n=1 Tax=Yersinia rochesterensis TaxID=1604335 RepID=A0A386HB20_9GAMM|nr:ornithine decarboxylase SpeF [Yersinia rochesterensis]AJI85451.1 beta-eliminating lyase family protein [Yersinia frederiksenii Y225]CNH13876.1 ornithine decarboxylase [Yersinia kristensenii]AIN20178.1 beta-eliminating lyase family protein [Yersinia rochesterensis]AJJ37557.1 beta-eliminating lyase family protein [Yersinia rochesterensis]AYD42749.1 ornithine decarboxylase SpeF [Yersinia rochesterensis]
MKKLNIAASTSAIPCFETQREVVDVLHTDFTDVAAVVLSVQDINNDVIENIHSLGLDIPIFAAVCCEEELNTDVLPSLNGVFELCGDNTDFYGKQLESAAEKYEKELLPPFFNTLKKYVEMGNSSFACPGHQGGQFFRKHPAGRQFFDFYGETIFRSDMCNADVKLGDLLIHEGAPCDAQKHAAKVFNADKTYFVLNGTSASNKVATNALLARGDLVLFDRNNHKSNHHGALIQAGATPVYLETARNPFGFIGGIDAHCFEEKYLREQIHSIAPERANQARPFRLAIIQLGTYDGTIYNARQVVDKIGHLCDYILFDSAWVGYEQFIPMMKDCSPLLLELNENDPGIIVTQSVHKQQAGFSQTSQIHKKDKHIKGQDRYCNHKRFNNAFMLHASTSPFYPLFAALDVNAKMHKGKSGQRMWLDCVKTGIEARKMILNTCKMIKPFVPVEVDGKPWQQYDTNAMAQDLRFFNFIPGEKWHAFEGYEESQYFVDPCKLLLTTPGIDTNTGEYTASGIPATILANFLRENGIVPEKCDLNSILFLLTPAEDLAKMQHLVAQIARFERFIEEDALLSEVLPTVYRNNETRYKGYTIGKLCQEMHDLYVSYDVKQLQKEMFRKQYFPKVVMNPQDANIEFVRGHAELVPLCKAEGRIAAEGALPYPPGVLCVVPGEVWGGAAQRYFLALEESINLLPGFAPELQGVYLQVDEDGWNRAYGYMMKNK